MAKKLLLCASTFHISAALWSGRRLLGCRGFEDDDAGHAAFQNLLRSASGVPVYLMADTVDEDYRFEMLPHASGSDRREMLERKLKQLYRSTPFYGKAAMTGNVSVASGAAPIRVYRSTSPPMPISIPRGTTGNATPVTDGGRISVLRPAREQPARAPLWPLSRNADDSCVE